MSGVMADRYIRPLSKAWRAVVIILFVILAWFVWPTPYRDLPCSPGAVSYGSCEHINRITGATCPLYQACWINPRMW